MKIVVDNDNKLKWLNSTDGTSATLINQLVSSGTVTANAWHHIAVDFDGTTARLYYDGNCVNTSATIRNIHATTATSNICLLNDNEAYTYWPARDISTKSAYRYRALCQQHNHTVPTLPSRRW
jgi:hypothetical protein